MNSYRSWILWMLVLLAVLLAACGGGQATSSSPPGAANPATPADSVGVTPSSPNTPSPSPTKAPAVKTPSPAAPSPTPEVTGAVETKPAALSLPDLLQNGTYPLSYTGGETVTLTGGEYRQPAAGASTRDIVVALTEFQAFGNLAGGEAAAAILASDPGLGVTFYDLAIITVETEQEPKVITLFLDDKIEIESLAIEDGQVVVEYLTQGPDDPLCCPSLPVKVSYELGDGELVQTDRAVTGDAAPSALIPLTGAVLDLQGLASSYSWTTAPATPYDDTLPGGAPSHLVITFDGQDAGAAAAGGPILRAYPIGAYQQLWQVNGDDTITRRIDQLEQLLQNRPISPGLPRPFLPPNSQFNNLAVHTGYLNFSGGSGIRYIGRFGYADLPVANEQLNYYFQGLTDDGRYYISLIFPIRTSALADTVEEMPAEVRALFEADPDAYIQGILGQLSLLTPPDWEPDLGKLDTMVESLKLGP